MGWVVPWDGRSLGSPRYGTLPPAGQCWMKSRDGFDLREGMMGKGTAAMLLGPSLKTSMRPMKGASSDHGPYRLLRVRAMRFPENGIPTGWGLTALHSILALEIVVSAPPEARPCSSQASHGIGANGCLTWSPSLARSILLCEEHLHPSGQLL